MKWNIGRNTMRFLAGVYLCTDETICKSPAKGTLEKYSCQSRGSQRREENGFPGIIQESLAQQRSHLLQQKNFLVITNSQNAHSLCLILWNKGTTCQI